MKLFQFFSKNETTSETTSETEYKENHFEIADNRDKSLILVKRCGITVGYIQYYESLNKWYYNTKNLNTISIIIPERLSLSEEELRLIADKLSELNKS